jgi:hypothetical protein
VLASGTVVELAHLAESDEWEFGKSVTLRGRSRPTRLGAPKPSKPPKPPVVPEPAPAPDEEGLRRVRFPRPLRPLRRGRWALLGALVLTKAAKNVKRLGDGPAKEPPQVDE